MHRKNVLFIQDGMVASDRYAQVTTSLDADFSVCSPDGLGEHLASTDLIIRPVDASNVKRLNEFEKLLMQIDEIVVLFVVAPEALPDLRLPIRFSCDFIVRNASDEELSARLRHLLWPGEETSSSDFITIGSMTMNLSTYQVQVNGKPLDFTYLEYALLAFLVTHPGHAYSRDALLRRVWGFEYYGGSRTVDVHVRRVRAKLGSELASRLETVRGVGYMWSA